MTLFKLRLVMFPLSKTDYVTKLKVKAIIRIVPTSRFVSILASRS